MRNGIDCGEMEVVADILAGSDGMRKCICDPPELENCPCIVCNAKRYKRSNDPDDPWNKAYAEATE